MKEVKPSTEDLKKWKNSDNSEDNQLEWFLSSIVKQFKTEESKSIDIPKDKNKIFSLDEKIELLKEADIRKHIKYYEHRKKRKKDNNDKLDTANILLRAEEYVNECYLGLRLERINFKKWEFEGFSKNEDKEEYTNLHKAMKLDTIITIDNEETSHPECYYYPNVRDVMETLDKENTLLFGVNKEDFIDDIDNLNHAELGKKTLAIINSNHLKPGENISNFERIAKWMDDKNIEERFYFVQYEDLDDFNKNIELQNFFSENNIKRYEINHSSLKNHYPTLVHYLNHSINGHIKRYMTEDDINFSKNHERAKHIWPEYVKYIDSSLRGNSQEKINYKFLIISEDLSKVIRKNPVTDKLVINKDYESIDNLENIAAIFISNEWQKTKSALGKGIENLKTIRIMLDEKGLDIPIIYQSGHERKVFSEEEIKEIEKYGGVLAPKDLFPKICKGKDKYNKEIEIRRVLDENGLDQDINSAYDLGELRSNELYVLCSKIEKEENEKENIGDNYSHRMKILAKLHTVMKDELDNDKLAKKVVNYFRDIEYIMESGRISSSDISDKKTKELYESIRQRHEKELENPTTIIHNDTKWDNWFNGYKLGDFGDCCAGTEYKDIARALLDKETDFENIKNIAWVDEKINEYINNRTDKEFNREEFNLKIKETIFLESLRIAKYRSTIDYNNDLVDRLVSVAEVYKNHLS